MEILTLRSSEGGPQAYIVGNPLIRDAILIDPGIHLSKIKPRVAEKKWTVRSIFLTHGHLGHAARVAEASASYKAPVYAHRKELTLLQRLPAMAEKGKLCGVLVPIVRGFLEDGESVSAGSIELVAWETPGHSPGSLTFQVEHALFVGDLVNREGLIPGAEGQYPPTDGEQQWGSVRKLASKVDRKATLYPGHGKPFEAEQLSALLHSSRKGRS